MFIEKFFKRRRRDLFTDRIQENNSMKQNKKKNLKGKIIFTPCRGHDTVMIHFLFEGFHDQHIRLLSRNYYFR